MGVYGGPYAMSYEIITGVNEPVRPCQAHCPVENFRIFPNPAAGIVNFSFSVTDIQRVTLRVHDLTGKELAVLLDNEIQHGECIVTFDAKDFPAGVYFCILQAGKYSLTQSLVVIGR